MNELEVKYIPGSLINTDKGVVEVGTKGIGTADIEACINQLVQDRNWSAFRHSRVYFEFTQWGKGERDLFFTHLKSQDDYATLLCSYYKLSMNTYLIGNSIYGWAKSVGGINLPMRRDYVIDSLYRLYPISLQALLPEAEFILFAFMSKAIQPDEEWVAKEALRRKALYKVLAATVKISNARYESVTYVTVTLDQWDTILKTNLNLAGRKEILEQLTNAYPNWAEVYKLSI